MSYTPNYRYLAIRLANDLKGPRLYVFYLAVGNYSIFGSLVWRHMHNAQAATVNITQRPTL